MPAARGSANSASLSSSGGRRPRANPRRRRRAGSRARCSTTRAGCCRTTRRSCWPPGALTPETFATWPRHTPATRAPHHGHVTVEPAPSEAEILPLAGYSVAVTAARRREELAALLDRRGARVVVAPAIRIVPLSDDAELVAATRAVLAAPVDLVVATTGVGFRGWLEAADAWDLPLVEHLRSARVLARGPKARGAIRGGGLVDAWSPESESSVEVLSHLLSGAEGPLEGRRIAVQLHGDPLPDLVAGLRDSGAEVLTVPVYRWVLPEDVAP